MRRMVIISAACIVLLFVPIYLWQVKGWQFGTGGGSTSGPPDQVPISEKPLQPKPISITELAKTDPIALLEESLRQYRSKVESYTCTLEKTERVHGTLRNREVIEASFQEKPFRVLMVWKEGRDLSAASLYSTELKKDKFYIRPAKALHRLVGTVERAPDAPEAKDSTRIFITEFGFHRMTEKTYLAWRRIKDLGLMKFEYLGVQTIPQTGNRPCHVIRRFCDPATEDDPREKAEGLFEVTIYVDAETWFQVGTKLVGRDGLLGEYYFRDIQFNPTFPADQFQVEKLKQY